MDKVQQAEDRGLELEVSYRGGEITQYGTKGSTRLDVYEPSTGTVYDYKFTKNPGQGLKQNQIDKIMREGPKGVKQIKEVNP